MYSQALLDGPGESWATSEPVLAAPGQGKPLAARVNGGDFPAALMTAVHSLTLWWTLVEFECRRHAGLPTLWALSGARPSLCQLTCSAVCTMCSVRLQMP